MEHGLCVHAGLSACLACLCFVRLSSSLCPLRLGPLLRTCTSSEDDETLNPKPSSWSSPGWCDSVSLSSTFCCLDATDSSNVHAKSPGHVIWPSFCGGGAEVIGRKWPVKPDSILHGRSPRMSFFPCRIRLKSSRSLKSPDAKVHLDHTATRSACTVTAHERIRYE
jgi:hypothetical protein